MKLRVKKVGLFFPDNAKLKAIFEEAFPAQERFPYGLMVGLGCSPGGEFLAYYDGDELVGMTYNLVLGDMVFIFYLAVSSKWRGQGYGSAILSQTVRLYPGKHICLDMEALLPDAPNYEQRLRRSRFYLSNGFHDAKYRLFCRGQYFDLLYYGDEEAGERCIRFFERIPLLQGERLSEESGCD